MTDYNGERHTLGIMGNSDVCVSWAELMNILQKCKEAGMEVKDIIFCFIVCATHLIESRQ